MPVAFAFIVILGLVGWRIWRADRSSWGENVGNFIAEAAEKARPYVERYQQAKAVLRDATIVPAHDADPINCVAQLLATSPRPLNMTEIGRALAARIDGLSLTPRQVGVILRSAGCFHRNRDGTWQVGRPPRSPAPTATSIGQRHRLITRAP